MRALAGSLATHALLALALASMRPAPAADRWSAIDVVVSSPEPVIVAQGALPDEVPGGNASAHDPPVHASAHGSPADARARNRSARDRRATLSARDDLAWSVDRPGNDGGDRGACSSIPGNPSASSCVAQGTGDGAGIGFGEGGAIAEPPHVPVLPPPPPASKARPPRLIYPTRERDIEAARLFIARLMIDRDGFVVGARLVRGFGGPRDDQAASAVWRFRYAPALDDDGAPIDATIEQPFMVE